MKLKSRFFGESFRSSKVSLFWPNWAQPNLFSWKISKPIPIAYYPCVVPPKRYGVTSRFGNLLFLSYRGFVYTRVHTDSKVLDTGRKRWPKKATS